MAAKDLTFLLGFYVSMVAKRWWDQAGIHHHHHYHHYHPHHQNCNCNHHHHVIIIGGSNPRDWPASNSAWRPGHGWAREHWAGSKCQSHNPKSYCGQKSFTLENGGESEIIFSQFKKTVLRHCLLSYLLLMRKISKGLRATFNSVDTVKDKGLVTEKVTISSNLRREI